MLAASGSLSWGALLVLSWFRPAVAQTQAFPTLPPPGAYAEGVFFTPNTSTAAAQVLKAGETLTIRWGTNFESVNLELVAGEDWDGFWELGAAIEDKEFDWVVDSYGNNSLPFSIVARNARGSEEERLEGGFMTGQFWIRRDDGEDDGVVEAENTAVGETVNSSSESSETLTRRVEATRTVMVTQTTARLASTSAVGDEEEEEDESMSRQMLSSMTATQDSQSQTTASGEASPTVNRVAAAASSSSPSSDSEPEETTASAGILLPSITSSAHDSDATSETLFGDDDDGKHSISTASLSSTSIAAIGLGAGLGLIVLVLVVVFVVAVWFRGRKRKETEHEYRKGEESGCECGNGREACRGRGVEERSLARASASPSPSPLRAREGQV